MTFEIKDDLKDEFIKRIKELKKKYSIKDGKLEEVFV